MTPAPIRLDQINLIVSNVRASRAFYEQLGLTFGNAHDEVWDNHHISADTEETALDLDLDSASFAGQWNAGWPGGTGAVLGFKVETRQAVDDLVAALAAAGASVQQEPYDAFWGARYAVVCDPDGHAVGIMSPMDDAHRSESPDPT